MGQSESHELVDDSVPARSLEKRTLEGVAQYIKDGKAKNIVTMVGAGISTSAGIPDFRSPDTGLYANLARLNLPYAEAVFDISYFRQNPLPFYTLAHELYPGRYRPTITHSFIALLERKGILLKNFTQNIDCLEREAGVSDDKIVEAHGSFATQRCIDCKTPYPDAKMKDNISARTVPHCLEDDCNGLVKPDIVFFGEQLPGSFFQNQRRPHEADLVIVLGTSLAVQPFASLPQFAREEVPRVLINLERVGTLGSRPDDVLILGDCDKGVRKLAEACGWLEELEQLWHTTKKTSPIEPQKESSEELDGRSNDDRLEKEIANLTKAVDETLQLNKEHTARVNEQIRDHAVSVDEGTSTLGVTDSVSAVTNAKDAMSESKSESMLQETSTDEPLAHEAKSNEKPSL